MASPTVLSLKSKMLEIMSFASSSSTPFSSPASTIIMMPSSVTVGAEELGSMPNARSTALVEAVRNETTGRNTAAVALRAPANLRDICSARAVATFFGTSSPNTSEK